MKKQSFTNPAFEERENKDIMLDVSQGNKRVGAKN